MSLEPGARIGTYDVTAKLGEGGMGEVYRATDTTLKREVALKVLPPDVATDPERLARLQREAELLAALNHPHIAQVYAVVQDSGTFALVMELVDGATLADRIAAGPLPLEDALAIARQIAAALEAAHEQGIVHRDLKPANIKVRTDGTVKVLDFGLAKAMDPMVASSPSATRSPTMSPHATMAGLILGTPAYMSPEQASGKPVDKRADIWAFGVVVWEMLTGRQMFEGETVSHVLAAVLTKEPELTAVQPRVRPLVTRCLQKDPKHRLRDIGDAMSLVAERDPIASSAAPPRRWSAMSGWAAAVALAAALAAALWLRPAIDEEVGPPVVRFQIDRQLIDVYNQTASAFAISPDGRYLAHYDADATGQSVLVVRTLATGERRDVPNSATTGLQSPFWSGDSRHLVFQTLTGAHVLDTSVGTTRTLCACRFRGGTSNRDGVVLIGSAANVREGLRRLSLEDRTPRVLTTVDPAHGEQDSWPVFLPDGRRFLFTRSTTDGGTGTYLGTLDGDAPRRIADGSFSLFLPSLGALGPHVLGIGEGGLLARAIDPAAATVIGESRLIVAGAGAASVSHNGVLATSTPADRPRVVPTWFDRTGKPLATIGEPQILNSIDLSADGRKLAVGLLEARGPGDIWLRDLASGAATRLTFGAEEDSTPVWSPDGRRIVISSRRNGTSNIYVRAADGTGSETRLVPSDRHEYANDWSLDGRWVIFTHLKPESGTDLDLWVVPVDGAGDRQALPYLSTPAREVQAQFSPDGRFVAFNSNESGTQEIYVQPFPNAADGKWMISRGGGVEPRWSRDGKELFYFSGKNLMVVPVALRPTFSSGSPVRLFEAPVQPGYANDSHRWQVSADATRFLLLPSAGSDQASPITVVVNWPALLTTK